MVLLKTPVLFSRLILASFTILTSNCNGLQNRFVSSPSSTGNIQEILVEPGNLATSDVSWFYNNRVKREAESSNISSMATAHHLNNKHLHLMVHWVGSGSPRVFCLGKDQKMDEAATSQIFLSTDYGLSFNDISDRFQLKDGSLATINKFYHQAKSNCQYVFTDVVHKYIFTSTDCGDTIVSHKLELTPEVIEFDPAQEKVFVVHDLKDNQKTLYVSDDFGVTYSHVQDFVKSFYFQYDDGDTSSTLYLQRLKPNNQSTILSSKNFFERQVDSHVVYNNAMEFEMRGHYIFVTKSNPIPHPEHTELFISIKGEKFVPAQFGNSTVNLYYHIIDVTDEGQILICVNHDETQSNLYVSTKITPYEVEFSLSLERVMFYNPKVTWHDSWLAATAGDQAFADVYKVQGLRGIYIASQVKEEAGFKDEIVPNDLISLITFDLGGKWEKIEGPVTDEDGYPFPGCKNSTEICSLHLSQKLSKRYPSTRSIPIMSSSSAVGIVMGTGNMGGSLSNRADVFVSADAGLSWHQVLKGSYYYTLGDYGGVLVAVKYFKAEGPTNELVYSIDEGLTWDTVKFYSEPLKIFGLLTEPGENTTVFTLFGTVASKPTVDWIIIRVDLKSVFERPCTSDDYRRWSPSDGSKGKHRNCILGRKEIYERRIISSKCYAGPEYKRLITTERCACDRSDYICDFGFKLDQNWTDICLKNTNFDVDLYAVPSDCKPGKFFNRTRGYIKIRGDSCEGGLAKRFEPERVLCPLEEEKEFLLVSQRKAIVRINLADPTDVETLPLENVNNVITLEFDMEHNCVMYGDIELDKIFIQCLNGSEPRILVENNLSSVEGMAYDWISKSLYFVDGLRKTIELVRVDLQNQGRMRKTILDGKALKKPRGLALHPIHGYLFYSDWTDTNPHIGRANMDGSMRKILFKSPIIQWPNGLAIDYIANRVYWVDAHKDWIASCDLDGNNFKTILQKVPELIHPFGIAVHKELMYWDDWNRNAIFYADKNTGKGITALQTDMGGAMDLKIFSVFHRSGSNPCSENPCSHLCVPMPEEKYQCLCPDGMKSSRNDDEGNKCICPDGSAPNPSGACPQQNGACDSHQFTCAKNQLCIPELWICDGEDDCGDNSDEIDCAKDKCSDYQFQCDNKKCIPRYWTCDFDNDCGDGSDEKNCSTVTCNKDQFTCDSGQCISAKWRCDREKDCQDGSDEVNCTTTPLECKQNEFQCHNTGQCLPNTWKCDGQNDCLDGSDEKDCEGETCKDWQFKCANGHCIFKTWECDGQNDCDDGSDEVNCSSNSTESETPAPIFPQGECNEWMFKCADEKCIPFWWKCDGANDCNDGSDEVDCRNDESSDDDEMLPYSTPSPEVCNSFDFRCDDGTCIAQSWVCDTDRDCPNGEDEDEVVCKHKTICSPEQFRCELSGECIDYGKICDSNVDCIDGSDEHGCTKNEDVCSVDYFNCDVTKCLHRSKMCNGHLDCQDGIDELGCSEINLMLMEISTDFDEINSTSIRVNWQLPQAYKDNLVEYRPRFKIAGTTKWQELPWLKIQHFTYVFTDLLPYTRYNLTLDVRKQGENNFFKSQRFAVAMTSADVPNAPVITEAEWKSEQSGIVLAWTAPSKPNGEIKTYIVSMNPSGREFKTRGNETSLVIDKSFLDSKTEYTFTVSAVNQEFQGESSSPSQAKTPSIIKLPTVKGLRLLSKTEDSLTIGWDNSRNFNKYHVTCKSRNPIEFCSNVTTEGTSIIINNLSPGEGYSIRVAGEDNGLIGPLSNIQVATSGKSLPVPIITDAQISPDVGTTVKLSWKLPPDVKEAFKKGLSYGIFYGVDYSEMFSATKPRRVVREKTSDQVSNLNACEKYSFALAIVGPNGYGRLSEPLSIKTKDSPGAPPKDVRVILSERDGYELNMSIKWMASCDEIEEELAYRVKIHDRVKNKTFFKTTTKSTSTELELNINKNVEHGTTYEVSVETDVANSKPSDTITINTPPIPAPARLTHRIIRSGSEDKANKANVQQLIYWHPAKAMSKSVAPDLEYQVSVSEHSNMSSPIITAKVKEPPYEVDPSKLEPGKIYYVSVKVFDSLGYKALSASPVAIENPIPEGDIVLSPRSAAGVLVPILIIVAILGSALGYYMYRNRRLTRSFQALTSRYNIQTGASILNQNEHALDDDDESPIIRGFSDDEPLVIS